jgi:hypothetical protein
MLFLDLIQLFLSPKTIDKNLLFFLHFEMNYSKIEC